MRWKKLFTPVENFDADQAKAYMAEHEEGAYTLLDVRQPGEYEQSHISGAKLIPLPQLSDRLDELNTRNPLLVYCAVIFKHYIIWRFFKGDIDRADLSLPPLEKIIGGTINGCPRYHIVVEILSI